MEKKNDSEEYYGVFLNETDKALLFVSDGQIKMNKDAMSWEAKDEIWFPKSKIKYDENHEYKRRDPIMIEIPQWLVKSKGLI